MFICYYTFSLLSIISKKLQVIVTHCILGDFQLTLVVIIIIHISILSKGCNLKGSDDNAYIATLFSIIHSVEMLI